MHPSWAAKQRQRQLLASASQASKKVVFDDLEGDGKSPAPLVGVDRRRRQHQQQQHHPQQRQHSQMQQQQQQHPSWQARKHQQALLTQSKPSGTKMVFNDD